MLISHASARTIGELSVDAGRGISGNVQALPNPRLRRDSCTARHLMQRTPRADADPQNRSRSGICRKSWILELSRSATTIVPSSSTATAGGVLN